MEYFSSKAIQCEHCNHRELSNGKTNYFHSVFTPVMVQPGNETVISLEPEFIVPQDGHDKQNGETQAAKTVGRKVGRFLRQARRHHSGQRFVQPQAVLSSAERPTLPLHLGVQARFTPVTVPDDSLPGSQ